MLSFEKGRATNHSFQTERLLGPGLLAWWTFLFLFAWEVPLPRLKQRGLLVPIPFQKFGSILPGGIYFLGDWIKQDLRCRVPQQVQEKIGRGMQVEPEFPRLLR